MRTQLEENTWTLLILVALEINLRIVPAFTNAVLAK
jgi:hypothetical protein